MKNLNSQLVLTADHDQVFHLRQMIGNYWVSQKILQIEFIFYIVFGVWLGLFENKIWWVCRVTFPRQYWLVWQYWQRVWIYMVWPASLFVVLLFLCTSPCWPSAHLSACCRNQSFPKNQLKCIIKSLFDWELGIYLKFSESLTCNSSFSCWAFSFSWWHNM